MNKILVNNEKKEEIINSSRYVFEKDTNLLLEVDNLEKDIFLIVSSNITVTLTILGENTNLNFHIEVEKNATLTFNHFVIDGSIHIHSHLNQENATFYFHNSIFSNMHSKNQIIVSHHAPHTISNLKNHGFSNNHANLILDVASYIPKESTGCISKQDNQIIEEENSLSQINPNLYIDNYDVEASHSAYVGEFKEQELFYLMSRGLTEESSKFLLLKSFLIGSFHLEDKIEEKYQEKIIKYFDKEV